MGKKKSVHAFTQEQICAMLVFHASAGRTVVRLKGGDPYMFGRGGEEAEALAEAGIPFEVVPGVTSALGLAAYSGIPLTHREHSSAVTFITGHDPAQIDWNRTPISETLVILMGLTTFPEIATRLIAAGRSPDTPAAAVRWATRTDQETVLGTLATLPGLLQERNLKPPATIVVGEVAQLSPKLGWFERRPLYGQTIVVTRVPEQSAEFAQELRELGANAIELPAIEIRPPSNPAKLEAAIARLWHYDWFVFTSANAVRAFISALDRSGLDARAMRGRIATVGPATARALDQAHLKPDLWARHNVAESLLESFNEIDLKGAHVLLPRAASARDILPTGLHVRGAQPEVVHAYETVAPDDLGTRAPLVLDSLKPHDWVVFTSSSTVTNLVAAAGIERLAKVRIATIGPITSGTVREFGLQVTAQASTYTSEGIIKTITGMA